VLVLLARPIVDGLGPHLTDSGSLGTLAVVGAGTGPAILVLSMAHPAVVKLRLAALEHTGATVGGLSAVGTLGALAGTFLTGFVLLGELSTRDIALGAGVAVMGLGVAVSVALRRSGRHRMLVLALPALAVPALAVLLANDGVCERDTRYYCARVEALPPGKVLRLDNLSHAHVDPRRPRLLLLEYLERVESIVDASRPGRQPLTVLHVGGGGFAYPSYLAADRPGTRSTVLELDPDVVEIAREELGLQTAPDLRVRTGDARMSILDERSGAFDLVVGDAFASRAVPWHLTTREFLAEVRRVLRPDGVYALNLVDGGELEFLRAELATLESVFDDVVVVANPRQVSGNFVVAASPTRLPLEALRRRAAANGHEVIDAATMTDGAPILTDEFAPVDQLIGTDSSG
jgi:SAM-dependent methyltransferase